MDIELRQASLRDCEKLHRMQVRAFQELLRRYGDTATNPGAEPLAAVERRMRQKETDYYWICLHGREIGALRVVRLPENRCRLSPLFLLPEFRGRGFAKQAMAAAEARYPRAEVWQLDTIKEEAPLCRLYEQMGYRPTGRETPLQDGMTIIDYEKRK